MKNVFLICGFLLCAAAALARQGATVDPAVRWSANPKYFDASSRKERRAALELWITSIQEQTQRPTVPDVDGELNGTQVQYIWRKAAPTFSSIFGRDYASLTDKERKGIAKELRALHGPRWVEGLAHPLEMPSKQGDGAAMAEEFARFAKSHVFVQASRQEKAPLMADNRLIAYSLKDAELLAKTPRYSLYVKNCTPKTADVIILFSIPRTEDILNDDTYWHTFEAKMLPLIQKRCAADLLKIVNHVEGFYIGKAIIPLEQATSGAEPLTPSSEMSSAVYSVRDHACREWRYGSVPLEAYDIVNNRKFSSLSKIDYQLSITRERFRKDGIYRSQVAASQQAAGAARAQAEKNLDEAMAKARQDLPAQRDRVRWLLQRNSAPAEPYSFAGYHQAELLQKIYDGKFREILPYAPMDALSLDGESATESIRRNLAITLCYLFFHSMFDEACESDPDFAFEAVSFRIDLVTSVGSAVVNTEEGKPHTYRVRTPYVKTFKEQVHSLDNNVGIIPEMVAASFPSADLKADLRSFIRDQGCQSPQVRQLEANLYLLFNGLVSIQELR